MWATTEGLWQAWQARAALASKPLPEQKPVEEYNGWYCAHCRRGVDGSEVTFREQHTECGRVITNDRPPAPLPEQVAQDKEHAENYRWLRDTANIDEGPSVSDQRCNDWGKWYSVQLLGDDLDAAIRAARTRGEGGGSHG